MINKDITMTPSDYEVLCDVVSGLHNIINDDETLQNIMGKIASMSVFDKADLSVSEINYGNMYRVGEYVRCIKGNKTVDFKIEHRPANKNDIVYITSGSNLLGDGYIGKYYRVCDRVCGRSKIRMIDTYGNCGEKFISLDDNQYIVLVELEGKVQDYERN